MLYWYHIYLNHPGGGRIANKTREVCYWKGLATQVELYAKPCKICQKFKKRNNIHGHLPPKIIEELKQWDLVHIDLIGPYSKSILQNHPDRVIIKKDVSLTYKTMIDPDTGWFEMFKFPTLAPTR